jgi:hypothetical protein
MWKYISLANAPAARRRAPASIELRLKLPEFEASPCLKALRSAAFPAG